MTTTAVDARDHVGLVFAVAQSVCRTFECAKVEDLLAEGYIALDRAAASFKPELGFRFSTYAHRAISRAMINFVDAEFLGHRKFRRRKHTTVAMSTKRGLEIAAPEPDHAPCDERQDLARRHLAAAVMLGRPVLTDREIAMLVRKGRGEQCREVAAEFGVSKSAVSFMQRRAMNKLQTHINPSALELVA